MTLKSRSLISCSRSIMGMTSHRDCDVAINLVSRVDNTA